MQALSTTNSGRGGGTGADGDKPNVNKRSAKARYHGRAAFQYLFSAPRCFVTELAPCRRCSFGSGLQAWPLLVAGARHGSHSERCTGRDEAFAAAAAAATAAA